MRIQTANLGVTKLHRANIYAVGQTLVHETGSSTGINKTDILFVLGRKNYRIIHVSQ